MSDRSSLPLPGAKPPVTILCGFLGAGKTTLLNHLLAQADGRRWAAVVNDVAAINIDAAVVRSSSGEKGDVVELGNGCVCCSSRDELGETIAELAASGQYEHILVETTGVAEPRGIAALFVQKNPFGKSLSDFCTLSSLISVVDTPELLREWRSSQQKNLARAVPTSGARPVFELVIEQIECADVVILNKTDLVNATELAEASAVIAGLNAHAEIISAERGQISSEVLLDRARFDPKVTLSAATWLKSLNTLGTKRTAASGPPLAAREIPLVGKTLLKRETSRHEERFGITSMVYQARRPFAQGKWERFIAHQLPGLLRAKGFYWTAEQPDEMGFLSVAGGVVRYELLNYWWAARVEHGRVDASEVPAIVREIWQEPYGDRRQELVFIGVGLDEAAIRKGLDACLVDFAVPKTTA